MSRTKLIKLGSPRSQFNCRDRRRAKQTQKVKRRVSFDKKHPPITPELLNPANLVIIREEDKKYFGLAGIGFVPSNYSDIDYVVARYHQKLICSGQKVTIHMLSDKAVELFLKAGVRLTSHKVRSGWVRYFLKRCECVRAHLKKLRDPETDTAFQVSHPDTPLCGYSKPFHVSQEPQSLLNLFATPSSEKSLCQTCLRDESSSDSGVSSLSATTDTTNHSEVTNYTPTYLPNKTIVTSKFGVIQTDTASFLNPRVRLVDPKLLSDTLPTRQREDYCAPIYSFPGLLPPKIRRREVEQCEYTTNCRYSPTPLPSEKGVGKMKRKNSGTAKDQSYSDLFKLMQDGLP